MRTEFTTHIMDGILFFCCENVIWDIHHGFSLQWCQFLTPKRPLRHSSRFSFERDEDDVTTTSLKSHQWHTSRISNTREAHDVTMLCLKTFITFFVTEWWWWCCKDVPLVIHHEIYYHKVTMTSQCQCRRVYCDSHHGSLLSRDDTDVTVSLIGRPLWRSPPRFLTRKIWHQCHNVIAMLWPWRSLRFLISKKKQWHHNVIDMQLWWHSLRLLTIKLVSMTSHCHVQAVIVTYITFLNESN